MTGGHAHTFARLLRKKSNFVSGQPRVPSLESRIDETVGFMLCKIVW